MKSREFEENGLVVVTSPKFSVLPESPENSFASGKSTPVIENGNNNSYMIETPPPPVFGSGVSRQENVSAARMGTPRSSKLSSNLKEPTLTTPLIVQLSKPMSPMAEPLVRDKTRRIKVANLDKTTFDPDSADVSEGDDCCAEARSETGLSSSSSVVEMEETEDPTDFFVVTSAQSVAINPEGSQPQQQEQEQELSVEQTNMVVASEGSRASTFCNSGALSPRSLGILQTETANTASTFTMNYWKSFREESRVLGLDQLVILLAIPRFKRTQEENNRWEVCDLYSSVEDNPSSNWVCSAMQLISDDPACGDRIFRGLVPFPRDKNARNRRASFYFKNPKTGEEDRPAMARHLWYVSPCKEAGIISLRDGETMLGDAVLDVGIALKYASVGTRRPVIHYFDEGPGKWNSREMCTWPLAGKMGVTNFYFFLCVRRISFTIHDFSTDRFIKDKRTGGNFFIGAPGHYSVFPQGHAIPEGAFCDLIDRHEGGLAACDDC